MTLEKKLDDIIILLLLFADLQGVNEIVEELKKEYLPRKTSNSHKDGGA